MSDTIAGHDTLLSALSAKEQKSAVERHIPIYECFEHSVGRVVFFCPVCNRQHFHGMPKGTVTHRTPHCSDNDDGELEFIHERGYYLVKAACEYVLKSGDGTGYWCLLPERVDGGYCWTRNLQMATRFPSYDSIVTEVYERLMHLAPEEPGMKDNWQQDNSMLAEAYKELVTPVRGSRVEAVAILTKVSKLKVPDKVLEIDEDSLNIDYFSLGEDDED